MAWRPDCGSRIAMRYLALSFFTSVVLAHTYTIDRTQTSRKFNGLGGISGGGATSRLLVDYKEPERSHILDLLFQPSYGASLQILKVEIGGDSQSTDGCESSHMHTPDDLDYKRGYEWWLLTEAKKRNPDIKTYGLAWDYPGWVGKGSGSPFTYPELTAEYITKWVQGAKTAHGISIDYVGIWNERPSNGTYVKRLRQRLDAAGFYDTQIVAKDGGADICDKLAADPEYAAAVGVVGLHYPSDFESYSTCHALGKPLWASEESSSFDDLNGAACWARVVTSHWVISQMTSSIMWNLVGSYYHGTNWYASSHLTAVQPWSGHYTVNPVVWASAHVTQFTQVGWKYLPNQYGSGELTQGGYYATLVDPKTRDFTLTVVKIDHKHAACTRPKLPDFNVTAETASFTLAPSMGTWSSLALWRSNFETGVPIFAQEADIHPNAEGVFSVDLPVGTVLTISSVRTARKGTPPTPPASQPSFPLPYADTFQDYVESSEARWFADQAGIFEIHAASAPPSMVSLSPLSMKQMVPEHPIDWVHDQRGPLTLIGMREWQDVISQVSFFLPEGRSRNISACLGHRADQMAAGGVFVCVNAHGHFNLSIGGPVTYGESGHLYDSGVLAAPVAQGKWHTLSLSTQGAVAKAWLNKEAFITGQSIRDTDTGFVVLATNDWAPVEFMNFSVDAIGPRWVPPKSPCAPAKVGTTLAARNCTTNGLASVDQTFELRSNFQLVHTPSGLCAEAVAAGSVILQKCDRSFPPRDAQQFFHDYTRIRNLCMPINVGDGNGPQLEGDVSGKVEVRTSNDISASAPSWYRWAYFPNTKQLRNQYTALDGQAQELGYPMCLSTCG